MHIINISVVLDLIILFMLSLISILIISIVHMLNTINNNLVLQTIANIPYCLICAQQPVAIALARVRQAQMVQPR